MKPGAGTGAIISDHEFTLAMLEEAAEILKALAPEKAPEDHFSISCPTGLKIIKAPYLSNNTVLVSPDLYDVIYRASK